MPFRYLSGFIEQAGLLSEITDNKAFVTSFIQRQLISVFSCRLLNLNRLKGLYLTFSHKA